MREIKAVEKKGIFLRRVMPACISALAMSGAMAQTSGNAAESAALEEVVVTGTRKQGVSPTETLSPVDVIGGDTFTNQASFNLTDSLTKVSPSLSTQRFPIADGTAFIRPITLRNLSPDQTLVLVNGTRRHRSALVNLQLAPLGTVNQGSQGVDFSAFPSAAIKRVEVLRDGASAQYGSDAIAGVVNVILNDASEGFNVAVQYGEYTEDDGERLMVSANGGFALGDTGFANLTFEHSTSDITSRGTARPDAAGIADIVGTDLVAYDGFGQRWGDPDIESNKFFINAGWDVTDTVELYGNASYMENETLSGFFYRGPVLDDPADQINFPARTTLQTDANEDGLPDPAPASLVSDILAQGLNPDDYLTPDGAGGYVLRNPIHSQFPGGYSPLFGADITDYAVVVGARGETGGNLRWDLTFRTAENEVEYVLNNSINPSLGRLSPVNFNPGTLTQEESGVNLDFVKTWDDSPLNMGFGFEWRNETYKIGEGDAASTTVGPTFAQFGVGSDGFQGFAAGSTGKFESDSYATYIDLETDITDNFTAAIAVRYEDYEEFDSTVDWKLSGRYQFTDSFAMRATVNTGFRAPTPGQVNTLNVTTSSDADGNLIPAGTYPVSHPIASALGAVELDPEESSSYTLGLIYTGEMVSITVDYYDITIEDRLALQSFTIDEDDVDTLTNAGIANAELLLASSGSYFVNGFESNIQGVDLSITTAFDLGQGVLDIDFRHNYNKQEISNVEGSAIGPDRVYDLENQTPNHSSVLTFNYGLGIFDGLVRFNRYDDWSTTAGVFGPGDASDATKYSGTTLVDLEARVTFDDTYTLAIGGENVFDEYPDDEANGTFNFLGQQYAVTSPWGFNGAFWYMRASASF